MKATGIIRRIDDLGRIVIPKEIRRNIGIFDSSPLEIFVDKRTNSLVLTPYHNDIPSKIRGIAENLNSLGNSPKEWEIVTELKKIADRLENLDE